MFSFSQAKAAVEAARAYWEACGDLKVTDGYDIEVVRTITGEYLDEPTEEILNITVLKVGGRWISLNGFNQLISLHTQTRWLQYDLYDALGIEP